MKLTKLYYPSTKIFRYLLIFLSIVVILYYGSGLILPVIVAVILASLLNIPMIRLQKWGVPKWASITIVVFLFIIVITLLMWLTAWQVSNIAEDWNTIRDRAMEKMDLLSQWSTENLGINLKRKMNNASKFDDDMEAFVTRSLEALTTLVSQSFIILIYIILLLMQKDMLQRFFYTAANDGYKPTVKVVIEKSSELVSKYLVGKGKLILILFVLYYGGFLLADVPYSLFLAFFASVFSIIPYVGNIIGGGIAAILAFVYSGTTEGLLVIGIITIAQLLENYVLTPWIIGDEINLNPFMTVFGVIVFSSLWGIVGAIIALPIVGVLKIIFEYTEGMEAAQYLLEKKVDDEEDDII